ncbi:PASTA domain-containing protein [Ornithinibacillus sp. BX22]|uniref:PASTA domain-containing protein n=2 Tax=Ornithinibacillus TaxID=484508 RepID=A0A923L5L6_9BACI|nr:MULTISPECIES: PASTA domain-containing protein [Ornithinibacillus]MBC5636930.1 PASTA domain-containing protein [Ornithinibacillus hominis]MBS3681496.1 PASTA domain-containing protein [Ornithinibacillus massiliensis]
MSDFLSKFNKDKYDDLVNEKEDKKITEEQEKEEETLPELESEPQQKQEEQASAVESEETVPDHGALLNSGPLSSRSVRRQDAEEDVEIDLDYARKKRLRMWLIISGSVLACIVIFFVYYMLVHVKVEDFVDKPVSDARTWAKENDVEIELTQEYSMEHDANKIISQSVSAGDKIRKGKTLQLTSSLGPDPEEVIPLPDFSVMSQEEARNWIDENKAENLQMVTEYSDDLEEGEFIKLTIKDSEIDPSEYMRKDSAAVYYSKGKEVFEKNITIPNFTGATKEEVEKWAEANEIDMTYEEADSDSVEAGIIISQSEDPEEKIAKRDKMKVVVSAGKATVVPNFGEVTADEAATNYPDLEVTVKQVFNEEVSYGRLISQSVKADTKLTDKDNKNVTVTYSLGKPYLGDFRGQSEGDLPRLFFDEYQSKGADIKYIVKYVYAPEVKGTVVGMSKFNEFVPMTYTVEIRVSNNASAPPNTDFFGNDPEGPIEDPPLEEGDNIEIDDK